MIVGKKAGSILVVLSLSIFGVLLSGTNSVFSGPSHDEPAAYDPVIASIVANVSKSQLTDYIWDLQNFTTRYLYTPELNQSATYILEQLGSNPNVVNESQYFWYQSGIYRNVLGILPAFNPNNETVYIVSGHYDSISNVDPMNEAPGADDDASGTAVAMEAARVLCDYKFNATIIFAGWTAEEVGLVGSEYYATDARENGMDIGMVLQFDMVGYDPVGEVGLDIISDNPSAWILNEFVTANSDYSIGLNLTDYVNPGAGASDHASFWQQGYQGMMAIESIFNTPNYHSPTDTIDKLNMDLVWKTTQAAVAVLAKIAGLNAPGVGVIHFNKTSYTLNDSIGIRLYDTDLNVNPGSADFIDVLVDSTSEASGEWVTLTETGVDTDVFMGSIPTTSLSGVPGSLTVADGDAITATYTETSPPGQRQAHATADGLFPVIRNVAAVPDVTSAVVTWDTDEISDSEVSYGLTPALGNGEADGAFTVRHSIAITGLSPDTRYYFEVASTDAAGNRARDDNGGSKYSFVTLPGSMKVPEYGYVGWVRDEEPTGNHFTDPEILVGHSDRRPPTYDVDYLGAAQFPTDPIPVGASITHARVEFYGNRWIYNDAASQWDLRLLDSSIDPGWTTHAFPDIESAVVEATIPQPLVNTDLAAGEWNAYEFLPSQFGILDTHLSSGRISFRIDGPRSPAMSAGVIFAWRSGYEGTSFATPYAPRLIIIHSLTNDTAGPLVTLMDVSPNPTEGSPLASLSAIISDEFTGMSNVSAAEYFLDSDPGYGKAMAMRAVDGSLDSVTESVDFLIDVDSVSEGLHTLFVRGMDSAGNWGPAEPLILNVTKSDTIPPAPVSNVTASLEGPSLQNLNVSWDLSPDDSLDVENYAVYRGSTYHRDGQGYEPIANLTAGSSFYVDLSAGHGDLSNYFYSIYANDTAGNSARSESQGGKVVLNLTQGEQLISVPFYQSDEEFWKDMSTASYSAIRAYDPTLSPQWRTYASYRNAMTLSTVDYSMGIWVNITSDSKLTLAGSIRPQFTIQLKRGWNLVGFPSPESMSVNDALLGVPYLSIEGFDASAQPFYLRKYLSGDTLVPGRGYWIEVSSDSTWMIQN